MEIFEKEETEKLANSIIEFILNTYSDPSIFEIRTKTTSNTLELLINLKQKD